MRSAGARACAALLVGAWVVVFLLDAPPTALLAVPLVVLGVFGVDRRAVSSVALVAAASTVTWLAGAPWGTVDMVLPFAIALYSAGRSVGSTWVGAGLTAVCVVTSALRAEPASILSAFVVSIVLFGSMWVFGRVVRFRALRAQQAVAEARALEDADPDAVSVDRVVEERARLADRALVTLRVAVLDMRASAHRARAGLDVTELSLIQQRGADAVDELRRLLGLLRAEPDEAPPRRARGLGQTAPLLARTLAPIGLMLGLIVTHPQWDRSWTTAVLWGTAILAVVLVHAFPRTAGLGLAAATLCALFDMPADPESLMPAALAYAVIAWVLATAEVRGRWSITGTLGGAAVVVALPNGPMAIAFIATVFLLPTMAGWAWSERDRILRTARAQGESLRAQLDTAAAKAVRNDRLRLAKELHDVAGHAVGVMVTQAGVALALREKAPERARSALEAVVQAGEDALAEIDALFGALDACEFGDATRRYAEPGQLRAALERMVAGVRRCGYKVELRLAELPSAPPITGTLYRVVQESLTNALRHSVGGDIAIEAWVEGRTHHIRVVDTGRPVVGRGTEEGSGSGLRGLEERVRACGGEFEAGASAGGFVVHARMPVQDGRGRPAVVAARAAAETPS
ncbi:hypothetical protein GCM10010921_18500 [Microbacterium album]|uniref:histidine kinase n=2 Tax=Microbacterium album TaxID=2053191 RepID=A0A917IHB8_9MICO|nr:hypothetical protein GCM10010921_18500 [Microbacterium album]